MPSWLKFLIAFGILGAIVAGIMSFFVESSDDVIEAQIESIQGQKLTEAYYHFTSPEFQKATSLEEFKEFIKPLLPIVQTKYSLTDYPLDKDSRVVRGTFDNNHDPVVLEYKLVKQDGEWKILNIRFLGKAESDMAEPAANEPDSPVKNFLAFIKAKEISNAYEQTTSSEFKKTIPPNVFQDFISNILIFTNFSSYEILSTNLEKNTADIKVLIHQNGHLSHVQFLTLVEDNQWKIRAIEILSSDLAKSVESLQSEDIVKPIRLFLDEVKKGELQKAYDNTTESFRSVSSFKDLEKFLQTYPYLTKYDKINFYKIAFDNNIAIINSQIVLDNKTHDVQFYLIQENHVWKIAQINIRAAVPEHASLGQV